MICAAHARCLLSNVCTSNTIQATRVISMTGQTTRSSYPPIKPVLSRRAEVDTGYAAGVDRRLGQLAAERRSDADAEQKQEQRHPPDDRGYDENAHPCRPGFRAVPRESRLCCVAIATLRNPRADSKGSARPEKMEHLLIAGLCSIYLSANTNGDGAGASRVRTLRKPLSLSQWRNSPKV
jgi:hypothetical protein